MKKIGLLLLVIIASIIPMTACGRRNSYSTNIDVTMVDYLYEPNEIVIPAGQQITLNLTNNGAVHHELVIMKLGTTVGESFGDEDEENIYWEQEVEPGQQMSVAFTAPSEPGVYQFVCGIEGHYTAGMKGTIRVVAP